MAEEFVKCRLEGIAEYIASLKPESARKAGRRAMKRMTEMTRTVASSTIRDDYQIKKGDLDPFMVPQLKDWQAQISVTGKPISLIYFQAKQLTAQNRVLSQVAMGGYSRLKVKQLKRASRTLQQGVTYQVAKGKTLNLPHAFIAYDPRLKRYVVWYRKNKSRGSVRSVNVITIASLFINKKTMQAMLAKVDQSWPNIIKHELLFELNRQGG